MKTDKLAEKAPDNAHFQALSNNEWRQRIFGDSEPGFVKGMQLSEIFFRQQVEPIVRNYNPQLRIAAGRLDYGSDVLGYDTEVSRDHAWGPQVTLFLSESDRALHEEALDKRLQEQLPERCEGYPTRMTRDCVWHLTPDAAGHHRVRIESVHSFFQKEIALHPGQELSAAEWLSFPAQKLRVFASGRIFVDEAGELTQARESLRWYPHDLWLHVMACHWQKIAERAPFAGRCAHVGDGWGATDNAQHIIRNLVYLGHLLEKKYPPYTKWLGTSLQELSIGKELTQLNIQALRGDSWPQQEDAVLKAYQLLGGLHNRILNLPTISLEKTIFHSRPYQMIDIQSIIRTLKAAIKDPEIQNLSLTECAIWQMSEHDLALCSIQFVKAYRNMIQSGVLR